MAESQKKLGGKKKGNGANSKRRDRKQAAYQRNLNDRQKRVGRVRNMLEQELKEAVKYRNTLSGERYEEWEQEVVLPIKFKIVQNEGKAEKLHRLIAGKRQRKSTLMQVLKGGE